MTNTNENIVKDKKKICEHCGCEDWYSYESICVGCNSHVCNPEPEECYLQIADCLVYASDVIRGKANALPKEFVLNLIENIYFKILSKKGK